MASSSRLPRARVGSGLLCVLLVLGLAGCQTVREIASLRDVRFAIDRVADAELAGIDVSNLGSYEDIQARDALNLTAALARNELPFQFTLHLDAANPADNETQARLVGMDWTLLLDGQETISGTFDQNVVLPPGEPQDIPIAMQLDLFDFFQESGRDLVDLALAIAGQGGEPQRVQLRAVPKVETPIGEIQYPEPITIASREVGS